MEAGTQEEERQDADQPESTVGEEIEGIGHPQARPEDQDHMTDRSIDEIVRSRRPQRPNYEDRFDKSQDGASPARVRQAPCVSDPVGHHRAV